MKCWTKIKTSSPLDMSARPNKCSFLHTQYVPKSHMLAHIYLKVMDRLYFVKLHIEGHKRSYDIQYKRNLYVRSKCFYSDFKQLAH